MPGASPILTIGIPAFNEGKFLHATLNSIRSQIFTDYVVYICDDSSTDDTVEIAKGFASKDPRFKVLTSNKKLTFTANWGRSLDMCKSEFFSWIGAHDVLDPRYFEEALSKFQTDRDIVLVYPRSVSIDADGNQGSPMDSDIETEDRSEKSVMKVAFNLTFCTAIHGVFRADVLKALPLKRIIGFDYAILFLASTYGKIKATDTIRFYRRVVRQESPEQAIDRWRKSGMFEATKYSPFVDLIALCVTGFYRRFDSSTGKRLITAQKLIRIFASKHSVSALDVLRCMVYHYRESRTK